ncbi:MAG: FprA family A-type flavoprotein [Clostridia bacterium]
MAYCMRHVTEDILWVGASDRRLALFENLFPLPNGVSYNAYLLLDEKTALIDTVDASVAHRQMENVAQALGGRALDYLVVNHLEPDHCANILDILSQYPEARLVTTDKGLKLLNQFYDCDLGERVLLVKEGDQLALGKHVLRFIAAPMVHWPEVTMAFDETDGVLFSADAFGTFGALSGSIFADELPFARDWLADARRYYANIVGKYGVQVQNVLKKAAGLPIKMICPLHGPIWREDLGYILGKYDLWSRGVPEARAVAIFYGSMYGHTENAADILAMQLAEAGVQNIVAYDVSKTDVSYLISELFRVSHVVLAAPTYNNNLYRPMETLLSDMKALCLHDRTFALIENGSWAPQSGKLMSYALGEMKNMTVLTPTATLRSALTPATREALSRLAEAVAKDVEAGEEEAGGTGRREDN